MRASARTLLVGAAACLTAVVAHPAAQADDGKALLKDDKVSAPDANSVHEAGESVGYVLKSLDGRPG